MAEWRCAATNRAGEPCGSRFRSTENPEFCSRHDPALAEFWLEAAKAGGKGRRQGRATCALEGCRRPLPKGRAKWCSNEHQRLGAQRNKEERKKLLAGVAAPLQVRRPPKEFYDRGLHLVESPTTAQIRQVAMEFAVDRSTVTRWYAYVSTERAEAARRAGWQPPPRHFPERWRDLAEGDVPAMVSDFLWFRGEFFLTEDEEPFANPDYMVVWIESIMATFVTRGRLMILSPPRHGKTELLTHLVIWLVCRFPNIRIVWVGPNDDLAQDVVGASILEHLEFNDRLVDAFCPPGQTFAPPQRGRRSWNKEAATVATRTVFGIKSPTLKFMGRGGTLVSRDADVIICDDIEQDKSVMQPGTREKTRMWATTSLFSRQTAKTAVVYIGSRQHPDDLAQHLLDNELVEAIVESAHDSNCEIDRNDPAQYDRHVDCMLWPEQRSYAWLKEMEILAETMGGRDTFEMVYLNKAHGRGLVVFEATDIVPCRDKNYRVGVIPRGIEGGSIRLIAGLDPSGTGYQAAFLWAYQVQPELRMWMVDLENEEGGGIAQARGTIMGWHQKYGVTHWVIEENLYQGGIIRDEKIVEYRNAHGLSIEGHWTYGDKWDPYLGVSTLKPLFVARQIVLPYGDPESQAKSDLYQRQLTHFSDAPRNRNTRGGYKVDLVMASWFPMGAIRRAVGAYVAELGIHYEEEAAFSASDWDLPIWDDGFDEAVGL